MHHIAQRRASALAIRIANRYQGERTSLHNPFFNLREVAKQLILLEDHLTHPYKACPDCIRKHLMTVEALAEEAGTLDSLGVLQGEKGNLAEGIAEMARLWMENIHDDRSMPEIAIDVRKLRKELAQIVCDPRTQGITQRVASRHLQTSVLCTHR